MEHRLASDEDLHLLAAWNSQLIQGGDRRNPMAVPELRQQMRRWLHGEYRAVLFTKNSEPVADVRYREGTAKTYLTLEILPKKKG